MNNLKKSFIFPIILLAIISIFVVGSSIYFDNNKKEQTKINDERQPVNQTTIEELNSYRIYTESQDDCPRSASSSNQFLLCGYVLDFNNKSIPGVKINVLNYNDISTITDSDGYFEIQLQSPRDKKEVLYTSCFDETVHLLFTKTGYVNMTQNISGVFIYKGVELKVNLKMKEGYGNLVDGVYSQECLDLENLLNAD